MVPMTTYICDCDDDRAVPAVLCSHPCISFQSLLLMIAYRLDTLYGNVSVVFHSWGEIDVWTHAYTWYSMHGEGKDPPCV